MDGKLDSVEGIRRALREAGGATFRVEAAEEAGKRLALIHVFGAYDCKGTEAEVAGLLKAAALPWRIVWH